MTDADDLEVPEPWWRRPIRRIYLSWKFSRVGRVVDPWIRRVLRLETVIE